MKRRLALFFRKTNSSSNLMDPWPKAGSSDLRRSACSHTGDKSVLTMHFPIVPCSLQMAAFLPVTFSFLLHSASPPPSSDSWTGTAAVAGGRLTRCAPPGSQWNLHPTVKPEPPLFGAEPRAARTMNKTNTMEFLNLGAGGWGEGGGKKGGYQGPSRGLFSTSENGLIGGAE